MRKCSWFSKKDYDVIVVGGGINGAAIANCAAWAGASVLLVEKNDWASGTSSKSTKLLHGGIRYLENFEFDLVAESLKERFIQWKSAPHLVKPMRFIIPVYKHQRRPLWMMKLGVWLYDVLSGKYSLGGHAHLSVEQVTRLVPGIKTDGLLGGVSYFDAQMDDARLCLENVLMAKKRGADVINYAEVVEFLKDNGRTVGVKLKDGCSGAMFEARAKNVIVAAGPWTDFMRYKDAAKSRSRLRTTKGVHIIYRMPEHRDAVLLQSKGDKRIFFVIPFNGQTLIGTTDTDYIESPDDVRVDKKDIEYLLAQAKQYFPGVEFVQEEIIASFAGLRPLVNEKGSPSKVSRKHVIERNFSGVYYVMGGKYTTYRAIAMDTMAKALPQLYRKIPKGEMYEVIGSGLRHTDVSSAALRYGVEGGTVNRLMAVYGSRYEDVLSLVQKDPSLKARICSCSSTIRAQVVYAIETEMAVTADDIYFRRLGLGYNDCPTRECRQNIEQILSDKL